MFMHTFGKKKLGEIGFKWPKILHDKQEGSMKHIINGRNGVGY